jgi:preprotein translocase subunit SecY
MFMMTVGTIFLMWIGEILSQKGVGNGMSLIIFAGIISGLPSALQQLFGGFSSDQLVNMIAFGLIALFTVVAVVVMSEATRNIPLQYARHHAGNRLTSGVQTKLPLKLLMVGVMPIIFAVAFLVFPTTLAQFFLRAKTVWLAKGAEWIIVVLQNPWVYSIAFFLLVFGFTFFYASVVFRPEEMAENLQKQGAFVPGVRPGLPTQEYLSGVVHRLLVAGGAFLGMIAVLPNIMQPLTGSQNIVVGGTSVLIVVSVVVEIVKQVEAQIASYRYDQM